MQNHFHCHQMRLGSLNNGQTNVSPSSSTRCLPRNGENSEQWNRKSYDLNKTEPLVTRNAIEIVSSTLPCTLAWISCRDRYALILVQSPVVKSKDLKGSSCHGNWWTNVRLRDTAYWLSEHPQSALRLLHNKEN